MVLKSVLLSAAIILFITGIACGQPHETTKSLSQPVDPLVFICHPDWHAGDARFNPDSAWTENSWKRGLILSDMQQFSPKYILLTGDMIGGDWLGERREGLARRFAPGGTDSELVQACAETLYYLLNQRFRSFGMEPIASLGDHDLGDQNWPQGSGKAGVIAAYKQAFAGAYTLDAEGKSIYDGFIGRVPQRPVGTAYENTSFAFVDESVLFVTIDIFRFEGPDTTLDPGRGVLSIELAPEQEAWLDSLLMEAAGIEDIQFTVVQAHHPVLMPTRQIKTSSIAVKDYGNSSFWKLLQKNNVDVYVSGEMHALTPMVDAQSQVVHMVCGSFVSNTAHNYLVCKASDRRLEMVVREKAGDGTEFVYETTGKMIIDKASGEKVISGSGRLEPIDPDRILCHYACDEEDLADGVRNSGQFGSRLYKGVPYGLALDQGILGKALVMGEDAPGYFHSRGKCPTDYDCPRTLAAWVRTGQTARGTIWALARDDYCLYVHDGIPELVAESGTIRAAEGPHLNDGTWHHVAAVFPGGPATLKDVALYVDGGRVDTETDSPEKRIRTSIRGEIYVGANWTGLENPYHGSVDDLGLWTSALSDAEIASLHGCGREDRLKYNVGQMDSLFSLFREGTGDITVKGTRWMPAERLKGSPGALVLTEDGQYELILDDEGNGLSSRNLQSQ